MKIPLNKHAGVVSTLKPFSFMAFLPLVYCQYLHNFKWDAVNDFVPGSHYAGSRDMLSLSHENY